MIAGSEGIGMEQAESGERARCASGVYAIDDAQRASVIRGNIAPTDLHVGVVDGQIAVDRAGIFDELARTMRFPDYFGRNWDAVYDCLTDPSLLPVGGSVILLDGCDQLAREHPDQWQTAVKVFRDACAFWKSTRTPLIVLLHGESAATAGAPDLPPGCLLGPPPDP
jgi:RNAse (barnase) inhibitor barstar